MRLKPTSRRLTSQTRGKHPHSHISKNICIKVLRLFEKHHLKSLNVIVRYQYKESRSVFLIQLEVCEDMQTCQLISNQKV